MYIYELSRKFYRVALPARIRAISVLLMTTMETEVYLVWPYSYISSRFRRHASLVLWNDNYCFRYNIDPVCKGSMVIISSTRIRIPDFNGNSLPMTTEMTIESVPSAVTAHRSSSVSLASRADRVNLRLYK